MTLRRCANCDAPFRVERELADNTVPRKHQIAFLTMRYTMQNKNNYTVYLCGKCLTTKTDTLPNYIKHLIKS